MAQQFLSAEIESSLRLAAIAVALGPSRFQRTTPCNRAHYDKYEHSNLIYDTHFTGSMCRFCSSIQTYLLTSQTTPSLMSCTLVLCCQIMNAGVSKQQAATKGQRHSIRPRHRRSRNGSMHGSQEVASSTKLLLLWKVSNDALQPPLSVRSVMRASPSAAQRALL